MLLMILSALCLTACDATEPKELSCEEIISAYENAGYVVSHGAHRTEEEGAHRCYIRADLSEEPDSDYIYFITCFSEEQAKEIAATDQYNILVWLFAAANGEGRWLQTGTYGNIEYSYYNSELIKPFRELIK